MSDSAVIEPELVTEPAALVTACQYGAYVEGESCDQPARYKKHPFCHKHYLKLLRAGQLDAPGSQTLADALKIKRTLTESRTEFEANAGEYVSLHLQAVRKQAEKGISTGAEWALTHTRAVTPVEKSDTGPKISVTVGVALPGLGYPDTGSIAVQQLPAHVTTRQDS